MTPGLTSRRDAVAPPAARDGAARPWLALEARHAAIIAGMVVACLLVALVADVPVARAVTHVGPGLHRIASLVSDLGLSGYMLVISGLLGIGAAVLRHKRPYRFAALRTLEEQAGFVFATIAVSGILAQVFKHLVGRARPKLIDTFGAFHFDLFSIKASLASFPSGHTTSIFALALSLTLLWPPIRWVAFAVAVLVAAARVLLGAHYVSDVLGGAALGLAVTLIVADLFARRSLAFERAGDTLRPKGGDRLWSDLLSLLPNSRRLAS